MKNKVHIFIDESGNTALNTEKKGTPSHFIYTAVVVNDDNISIAETTRGKISKKHFQGNYIKGSNISKDEKGLSKRLSIISLLSEFPHFVKVLVVDKNELQGQGFQFKKSFYKFFQKIFTKSIVDSFDSYQIYLDKLGNNDFQEELKTYMDNYVIVPDLFNSNRHFHIADDVSEKQLLQLADFYSNCVFSYYCDSNYHPQSETIYDALANKLHVDFFPYVHKSYLGAKYYADETFNNEIYQIAKQNAEHYINDPANEKMKIEIVEYLLQIFLQNPHKLSSTKELLRVANNYYLELSQWGLRKIIGELRDKGVLIISPLGKYGYKLPCNENEIEQFFDRLSSSIIPMLQRLNIFNEKLSASSTGSYDILSKSNYQVLSKLVNTFKERQQ